MSAPRLAKPNGIGRPSMIHDARRIRKLLRLVMRGTPKRVAAVRCGIGLATFDHWMSYGAAAERKLEEGYELEPGDEIFRQFRQLILRAIADFESRAIEAAMSQAVTDRKPTVILEIIRRHPDTRERWNVPTQVEVLADDADGMGPASMSDAELAARLERLEAIARDREPEGVEG